MAISSSLLVNLSTSLLSYCLLVNAKGHPYYIKIAPKPFLEASHSNAKILVKSSMVKTRVLHITCFKSAYVFSTTSFHIKAHKLGHMGLFHSFFKTMITWDECGLMIGLLTHTSSSSYMNQNMILQFHYFFQMGSYKRIYLVFNYLESRVYHDHVQHYMGVIPLTSPLILISWFYDTKLLIHYRIWSIGRSLCDPS